LSVVFCCPCAMVPPALLY